MNEAARQSAENMRTRSITRRLDTVIKLLRLSINSKSRMKKRK